MIDLGVIWPGFNDIVFQMILIAFSPIIFEKLNLLIMSNLQDVNAKFDVVFQTCSGEGKFVIRLCRDPQSPLVFTDTLIGSFTEETLSVISQLHQTANF